MKGFLTKPLCLSLILAGLAFPALAQNSDEEDVNDDVVSQETPDADALPYALVGGAQASKPVEHALDPVVVSGLPNVSPEAVGDQKTRGLGTAMWDGTERAVADRLMAFVAPSRVSALNGVVSRLLLTSAAPPKGEPEGTQSLIAKRVEKAILFGNPMGAWALAKAADARLVDTKTFFLAAETALMNGDDTVCAKSADYPKVRPSVEGKKFNILCRFRAKDTHAAQVALDVLRAEGQRDGSFLTVAERNVLGRNKTLAPSVLSSLSTETLALLQIAKMPLPTPALAKADPMLIAAMLRVPAQQDVARLALAERAAERGLVSLPALSAVYREVQFSPNALASPFNTKETGAKMRALLFRAARGVKDAPTRIALAVKFTESASPALLNGIGPLLGDMLGDVDADPAYAKDAATVARIYMLADKKDKARDWLDLAQSSALCAEAMKKLWPQFALRGLGGESSFAADLDAWIDSVSGSADPLAFQNVVEPALFLFEAAGIKVPETVWTKVFVDLPVKQPVVLSPVLLERMRITAAAQRRAETVLLAAVAVGDDDLSMSTAVAVTAALNQVGLKDEAALFAQQAAALLAKDR